MANVKVKVPDIHGDEISISIDGDDPVVYKVSEGHVSVPEEHVDRFLTIVDGAEAAKPAAAKK